MLGDGQAQASLRRIIGGGHGPALGGDELEAVVDGAVLERVLVRLRSPPGYSSITCTTPKKLRADSRTARRLSVTITASPTTAPVRTNRRSNLASRATPRSPAGPRRNTSSATTQHAISATGYSEYVFATRGATSETMTPPSTPPADTQR